VCVINMCDGQEKWRLRQEESRVKSAQISLDQERLRLNETIQRERLDLEATKVGSCLM